MMAKIGLTSTLSNEVHILWETNWGKRYPHEGYGGCFRHWLKENNPKPYGSYGNGSAMRVSAVGWLYDSMERTREVARATANVTHNHPEGIKGAESTASAIYMARNGSSKEEIKAYIEREFHYDLSRTLDNIRTYYHHVESCQETVPEAIIAFLESKDFEDAIRNAVSLGGDTDTLGAITGSIAEAFYGIPAVLIAECKSRIDKGLMTDVLDEFDHVLGRSVDTYSDEVDETQANQMIEAAIDQYYIQQDNKLLDNIKFLLRDYSLMGIGYHFPFFGQLRGAFLAFHIGGNPFVAYKMLFTYPVAGAPDKVIALLVGMVLFVVNEANRVENQVIMQMVFIDVSCQNKLILAA